MDNFSLPEIKHQHPLSEHEKNAFRIEVAPDPCEWIEENIKLPSYYAKPGKVVLQEWQKFIIRALVDGRYKQVNIVGSTQVGKSFIVEMALCYMMRFKRTSFMLAYSINDVVKSVVEQRICPLILINPCLSQYVARPDDLTVHELKMQSGIIVRTGSAFAKNSIASFSSKIVIGSEVSKYTKSYDVIKMLKGRYAAHLDTGDYKLILESSPCEVGDAFHCEAHKTGTPVLYPHVKCPHCGRRFYMQNNLIKEIPNREGKYDHNFNRIRNDGAAFLECPACKDPIDEEHHIPMLQDVVYAESFDEIDNEGNILNDHTSQAITIYFNRLMNWAYKFSDSLSNFFEAYQSNNIESINTYMQEDEAVFIDLKSSRVSDNFIAGKCATYLQHANERRYPDEIVCATVGCDTQDQGYYGVVQGFAEYMHQYIMFEDYIDCDSKKIENQDMHNVYRKINDRIFIPKYLRENGTEIPILWGFMDRGGHKAKEVDYICRRIPQLYQYIGSTSRTAPLIEKSSKGDWYMGNKELLSKTVEKWSQSGGWFLPEDVSTDFITQFNSQYWEEKIDKYGRKKTIFIEGNNDHLRDCCNYAMAAAIHLQLEKRLFDQREIEKLIAIKAKKEAPEKTEKRKPKASNFLSRGKNLRR